MSDDLPHEVSRATITPGQVQWYRRDEVTGDFILDTPPERISLKTLETRMATYLADKSRIYVLEQMVEKAREELDLWLILVNEGGVPRYTITPGTALNTVVTSTKSLVRRLRASLKEGE